MFALAIRHLVARPRQTFLTLLGILFGATSFIVISGFFLGFQVYLLDQLVNNDAHIRISAREEYLSEHGLDKAFFADAEHVFWAVPPSGVKSDQKIESPLSWSRILDADSQVVAYTPQLTTQAIFTHGPGTSTGQVIGTDAEKQVQVTNIRQYMTQGRFEDLALGGNRIVLGGLLARKIGGALGDTVQVSNGRGDIVPFKVVGIFETGTKQLDEAIAYSSLSDAQRLARRLNEVNEIAVRLRDFEKARAIADNWSRVSVERVRSWDLINANFLNVFKIQNATRYLMIAVLLLVAGFGIYNILNVTVNQKKKKKSRFFAQWVLNKATLFDSFFFRVSCWV